VYAKTENNTFTRWVNLYQEYPNTSFPSPLSPADLPEGVVQVFASPAPVVGAPQKVVEGTPVFDGERWVRHYDIVDMTPDELEQASASRKLQRADAYRVESDPLFFKAQRGEATMEEWTAKVAEIKARYPEL
jgi:hypothetical protein